MSNIKNPTLAAEDSLLGGAEKGGQRAERVAGEGQSGDRSFAVSRMRMFSVV
jgi:hypothetical protein